MVVATSDNHPSDYVADFYWDWVVNSESYEGTKPNDAAPIGWNANYYDNEYDAYKTGEESFWLSIVDEQSFGSEARFEDHQIRDNGVWSAGFGTYLNALSGSDPSERDVEFRYLHNWSNLYIEDITFGTGGFSVDIGSQSAGWSKFSEVSEGNRKSD